MFGARKQGESEKLLNMEQVAELLGMSVEWVKKARRTMNLPHYKFGHSVRFRASEVEAWIKQRRITKE